MSKRVFRVMSILSVGIALTACAPAVVPIEEETETSGIVVSGDESRIIPISVDNWVFAPSTITAAKGEKIKVRLTGVEGTHGFTVPGLGINTAVSAGKIVEVELPTDAAGTFEFFCSIPCGSGHRDMKGTIVIE